MNQGAIERIETKLAFLENANSELSDEVYRLRQLVELLRDRLESLNVRLESLHGAQGTPADERPPHY